MKNRIIQGLTITMFLSLIFGFVAYRSGYFGGQKSSYQNSPNGSSLNNPADSILIIDSLKRIEMMYSSKSLILREHSFKENDSNKLKLDPIIYSSKSGIIIKPEDLEKIEIDSILYDTLKINGRN